MARRSDDVSRRLQVLMDVWNKLIELWEAGEGLTREKAVELLRKAYEEEKLSPIRGANVPPDLYDKEMASLYVIGKYGMGLDVQYPRLFSEVFAREIRYEEAIAFLLTADPEEAREKIPLLLGKLDDNELARMLRLKLTEVYFGFSDETALLNLLKALAKALPEKERIAVKYARFYTALKVARAIAEGEARDRLTKESLKQATALKISSLRGVIPDDKYIGVIAKELYRVPKRVLRNVLQLEGNKKRKKNSR